MIAIKKYFEKSVKCIKKKFFPHKTCGPVPEEKKPDSKIIEKRAPRPQVVNDPIYIQRARSLKDAGKTGQEVAEILNISRRTVGRLLKKTCSKVETTPSLETHMPQDTRKIEDCKSCKNSGYFTEKEKKFSPVIKGKLIEVVATAQFCDKCGADYTNNEQTSVILRLCHDKYRKKYGPLPFDKAKSGNN